MICLWIWWEEIKFFFYNILKNNIFYNRIWWCVVLVVVVVELDRDVVGRQRGVLAANRHPCEHLHGHVQLALLDEGKLVAVGTPDELKARIGGDILTVGTEDASALQAEVKERFSLDSQIVDGTLRIEKEEGHRFVPQLVDAFPARIDSVSIGKPTLEDVFVQLTGHRFWTDVEGDA